MGCGQCPTGPAWGSPFPEDHGNEVEDVPVVVFVDEVPGAQQPEVSVDALGGVGEQAQSVQLLTSIVSMRHRPTASLTRLTGAAGDATASWPHAGCVEAAVDVGEQGERVEQVGTFLDRPMPGRVSPRVAEVAVDTGQEVLETPVLALL